MRGEPPAKASVTFEYTLLSREEASLHLFNIMGQVVTEVPKGRRI